MQHLVRHVLHATSGALFWYSRDRLKGWRLLGKDDARWTAYCLCQVLSSYDINCHSTLCACLHMVLQPSSFALIDNLQQLHVHVPRQPSILQVCRQLEIGYGTSGCSRECGSGKHLCMIPGKDFPLHTPSFAHSALLTAIGRGESLVH